MHIFRGDTSAMRVILVEVRSLDGKLTDLEGRPPSAWASKEDQRMFNKLIRTSDAVIIGRNTYEVQKESFQSSISTPRIVLTKNVDFNKKDAVPGSLEFSSLSPRAILDRLRKSGAKQVLLASGPKLTKVFLREKLVDELRLTVEPVNFTGGSIKEHPYAGLKLLDSEILPGSGTQFLRYEFVK